MRNPGYSHIGQKILKLLNHESQMICRLVNPDWKAQMDQAYFWIQKCDKKGQAKELSDSWIDLVQQIERGSHLEQDFVECLMKWHGHFPSAPQKDLHGCTVMHVVAFYGMISLVEFIATYMDNPNPVKGDGSTPIHLAAINGHIDIVKFLASRVEDPNKRLHNGGTPIYAAARNGHIDVVKFLATKVENPNEGGYNGFTPIHVAALKGHTEIVKFLATRVENPNLRGPGGRTPLSLAAQNQHTDVVDVLLQQIVYKFKTDPTAFSNTLL